MVADLKYNAQQGVKICEIQQASLSLFNGDTFRNPEEESIHKELLSVLNSYNRQGWIVRDYIADTNLINTLASSPLWQKCPDILALFSNPLFLHQAQQLPSSTYDCWSYQGFLYINWSQLCAIPDFEKRFPGMIIVDKSSFPFWIDKYSMTQLFAADELLSPLKPRWGLYKKRYTKELATHIADDLQCTTFVIKPRGQFLGKGVIITSQHDLDDVLQYIITKKGSWAESKDPAYISWKTDRFDTFIVEEFIASDPIAISHLENKLYQPTMRLAFVLAYNNMNFNVHFLGGYWKTPLYAINDDIDFMSKNKDICKAPYYCAVDPATMQAVQDQLRVALPRLHRKMIDYSNSLEGYDDMKQANLHIILQEIN